MAGALFSEEQIKARVEQRVNEERARDRALAAINELKTRGTEDSKNIAIALEFIIKRI